MVIVLVSLEIFDPHFCASFFPQAKGTRHVIFVKLCVCVTLVGAVCVISVM